jgi:intraflagellar transport protein 122
MARCRDYVKKIAIYKDRLAVQLSSKIVIYELATQDDTDMQYQSATKINQKLDCNLLVVTSLHVILCQVQRVSLQPAQCWRRNYFRPGVTGA